MRAGLYAESTERSSILLVCIAVTGIRRVTDQTVRGISETSLAFSFSHHVRGRTVLVGTTSFAARMKQATGNAGNTPDNDHYITLSTRPARQSGSQ